MRSLSGTDVITTIAGDGTEGYVGDNGPATSAQISFPVGIAVDASGNIYIADTGNNRIRKVTNPGSSGMISTVAGNGYSGYSGDGVRAIFAQVNFPYGITVDASGNIYFAEYGYSRIRKVTNPGISGIISTVAGNGASGYLFDGVLATSAQLNNPRGVAVDASGNIYIADTVNHRIRKVTNPGSTGMISTVAGNGASGYSGDGGLATSAQLDNPYAVAVDASGNIYIADNGNHRVRMVTASSGIINTVAGVGTGDFSGDQGLATSAQLYRPFGLCLDALGNIYIADTNNHRVRKVGGKLSPTSSPSASPTVSLTASPTKSPSPSPTEVPSPSPTSSPSASPTE